MRIINYILQGCHCPIYTWVLLSECPTFVLISDTIISIVFIFIFMGWLLPQTDYRIYLAIGSYPFNWLLITVVGILSLTQFHTPLSIQCQNNKQDKGSITPSAVPSISFFNMHFQHFHLVLNLSRPVWYT